MLNRRRLYVVTLGCTLVGGCIADLPPTDFPCLVAKDLYNKYNEAYVFSPKGGKEQTLERVQEAERECAAGEKKPRSSK